VSLKTNLRRLSELADRAEAPFIVLSKNRHGDRDVEMAIPEVGAWTDHTPVLIDDIVFSGRTMIEAARGADPRGHGQACAWQYTPCSRKTPISA
jgi:phosphoribosylpyrophosphate synthetase